MNASQRVPTATDLDLPLSKDVNVPPGLTIYHGRLAGSTLDFASSGKVAHELLQRLARLESMDQEYVLGEPSDSESAEHWQTLLKRQVTELRSLESQRDQLQQAARQHAGSEPKIEVSTGATRSCDQTKHAEASAQLDHLDRQIRNARRRHRDISQDIERIRESMIAGELPDDQCATQELVELREILFRFEKAAEELLAVADAKVDSDNSRSHSRVDHAVGNLKKSLEHVYRDLHQNHNRLARRFSELRRDRITERLERMRRTCKSLEATVEDLLQRRSIVLAGLAESNVDRTWLVKRCQEGTCACAETDEARIPCPVEGAREESLELTRAAYHAWENERIRMDQRLQDVHASIAQCTAEIETTQKKLKSATAKRSGWLQRRLGDASRSLSRLTGGTYCRIALPEGPARLIVRDAHANEFEISSLPPIDRDLALISIALACLSEDGRHGRPVIWNVALDSLRYDQAIQVGELAQEHCGQHKTLMITTCLDALFDRMKRHGFRVHERNLSRDPRPMPPIERAKPQQTNIQAGILLRENNSDSEEFPGEFRDQVIVGTTDSLNRHVIKERSREAYQSVGSKFTSEARPAVAERPPGELQPPISTPEWETDRWKQWTVRHEPIADETNEQVAVNGNTRIRDCRLVPADILKRLESHGVVLVRDLLNRTPEEISREIGLPLIEPIRISVWRKEINLRCQMPRLGPFDARMLVACGLEDKAQIRALPGFEMANQIDNVRSTETGQRLLREASDADLARLNAWIHSMRDAEQLSSFGYREVVEPSSVRPAVDMEVAPQAAPKTVTPAQANSTTTPKNHRIKFYLEHSDEVEAAPSIGPKTAENLADAGVFTIAQLLECDPEDVARQLDNRRIKADTIREWQKQARMVCQVPNLRGHDAQILVAIGIESADALAAADAGELFEVVGPFADTREGAKIIRAGRKPDLNEVTDWVNWARLVRRPKAA